MLASGAPAAPGLGPSRTPPAPTMAGATECGTRNADALAIQTTTQTIRGELHSCARSDRRDLECCRPLPSHNGVVAFRASGAAVAMTAPLPAALVSRGAIRLLCGTLPHNVALAGCLPFAPSAYRRLERTASLLVAGVAAVRLEFSSRESANGDVAVATDLLSELKRQIFIALPKCRIVACLRKPSNDNW